MATQRRLPPDSDLLVTKSARSLIVLDRCEANTMKKLTELQATIDAIFSTNWQRRKGNAILEAEEVRLGNDAVELDATVLYADLAESTALVKGYKHWFAAEVYKSYLMAASELIKNNGGKITA